MLIRTAEAESRERYSLLTALVVPRPIAWVSTRSRGGVRNLAPFSYYAALAATPMLIGVSVGNRPAGPKDTLRNIRETEAFCVNFSSESDAAAINASSAELPHGADEFEHAGVEAAEGETVAAPYVAGSLSVFECRLYQEVSLGAFNTLVIGEVLAVRLAEGLARSPDGKRLESAALRPLARLGGDDYAGLGAVIPMPRPR